MADGGTRPQAETRGGWRLAVLGLLLVAGACIGRREPVGEKPPAPEPERVQRPPETNRVAVLVPLTGASAGVGTSIANAAKLALLDSGETGVTLTVYDTGGGAALAANAALSDGNRLFLGPLLAEDVRAVAGVARRGGVPVIAFAGDTGVAGNGTYVMGATPDQSIGRTVAYLRGRGAARFAALVPVGAYGERARDALTRAVKQAGGTSTVRSYDRGTASLTAAARALGAAGRHDAVLIADTTAIAAAAVPLVRTGGLRGATVAGTEQWSTDRLIGGKAALRGAVFAGVPDARFDQLVTRYRAHYGKTPYRLASLGYDGVLLAVRINRDWDKGARFPERLLTSREGFSGVDGAFRFNADGTAERQLAVHRVGAKGAVVVLPAQPGFAP